MKYKSFMKYKILILIFSICLISASLLSFVPIQEICGETFGGCYEIKQSSYQETFGISNNYIGLFVFTILIILAIYQIRRPRERIELILNTGIILSSIIAAYFIYLQAFVIGAFCLYCMIIDIGCILALITILIYRKK